MNYVETDLITEIDEIFQIKDESEILKPEIRANFIKFLTSDENTQARINESLRRYAVYCDRTNAYVLQRFKDEAQDPSHVEAEIKNRISNVSIGRYIVDKKARVFGDGTRIEVKRKKDGKLLGKLLEEIDFINNMKDANAFVELQKNIAIQFFPYENVDGKYIIKQRILQPHSYHALASVQDKKTAVAFAIVTKIDNGQPEEIVWWSDSYHFTTDGYGAIISELSPDNSENQFGVNPVVPVSEGHGDSFWRIGGNDIIDGSINFNVLLTDTYYISKYQGMGIFYAIGKGMGEVTKVGPSVGIFLEQKEGDPTPQVGFANSNPPIDEQMRLAEQCIALILSTNDIDSSGIAGTLTNQSTSGFHEAMRKAEFIGDIDNKRSMYMRVVKRCLKVLFKMVDTYNERGLLDDDFLQLGRAKMSDMEPYVKFPTTQLYSNDQDKIKVIDMRRESGLDNIVDSVIRDNQDLTRAEAIELLKQKRMETLDLVAQGVVKEAVQNIEGEQYGKTGEVPAGDTTEQAD